MFAVIEIPNFALQAVLRFECAPSTGAQFPCNSQPVGLVDASQSKPILIQLTAAAQSAGVEIGMTPTQAMARCRHILIKNRSLEQENAASNALLQCAFAFSPSIEATAPGLCTLDLQGLKNASDETFALKIIRALTTLHLRAQVGIAANPILATHAARQARPALVVTDPASFLADIPIQTLNPSPPLLEILQKWGIRTFGAFIALGKDAVAKRLGPEAIDLFDRAAARSTRPLHRVVPPDTFEETTSFENEIETLEPLLFSLRRFLEQLCARLELAGRVAESLHLQLGYSDGTRSQHDFRIPAPTRQVETLFRMLFTHLETVRAPHPITHLHLSAAPCRESHQQFTLFETALRDPNHFHETLARLTALLGSDRVGVPSLIPTHRPDAFQLSPPVLSDKPDWIQAPLAARPAPFGLSLRRFRPPLSIQVQFAGEQPARLQTGRSTRRLIAAHGPWHCSGDWWDQQSWAREEWDVQAANGALYRIFQQNDQWYLEGMYD